jgi:hypothetical protein
MGLLSYSAAELIATVKSFMVKASELSEETVLFILGATTFFYLSIATKKRQNGASPFHQMTIFPINR